MLNQYENFLENLFPLGNIGGTWLISDFNLSKSEDIQPKSLFPNIAVETVFSSRTVEKWKSFARTHRVRRCLESSLFKGALGLGSTGHKWISIRILWEGFHRQLDPLKDLNAKRDHGILSLEQSRLRSPQTRREQLNAQLLAYFVSLNEKASKGIFLRRFSKLQISEKNQRKKLRKFSG